MVMTNPSHPRNRKERRAQARANPSASKDIPLNQPSREPQSSKTLLDIVNERQLLTISPESANPSITTAKIKPDGSLSELDNSSVDSPGLDAPPYVDIALYTVSLTLLHFTLSVLVHNQYATEPPILSSLFYASTVRSPTPVLLFVIVAVLHPRSSHVFIQALFAVLSLVAGAWMIRASNEDPYLAVMKKAPPLGTLWVWAIVEMRWEWAVGCLVSVGAWGWWQGYSIL